MYSKKYKPVVNTNKLDDTNKENLLKQDSEAKAKGKNWYQVLHVFM